MCTASSAAVMTFEDVAKENNLLFKREFFFNRNYMIECLSRKTAKSVYCPLEYLDVPSVGVPVQTI